MRSEDERKLHVEELHGLRSSPDIMCVIKWRMRWAGCVAYTGKWNSVCRVLVEKPE